MKQRITMSQVHRLPSKSGVKLKLWLLKRHCYPDLTIRQMIEFLDEYGERPNIYAPSPTDKSLSGWRVKTNSFSDTNIELCDALWEVVKKVLEGK